MNKIASILIILGTLVVTFSAFSFTPSSPYVPYPGAESGGAFGISYDLNARIGIAVGSACIVGGFLLRRWH